MKIDSPSVVRSILAQTQSFYAKEYSRRALLKGMENGDPPYDPVVLQERNLEFMTNVNFMEMRGILDGRANAFYELFFDTPTLVHCTLDPKAVASLPLASKNRLKEVEAIVSEEVTRTWLNWPGFLIGMDRAKRDSDLYGYGVAIFRDPVDWRPHFISVLNFQPDPDCSVDIDSLQYFFVYDHYTVQELFRVLESTDEEDAVWSKSVIRNLIVDEYNRNVPEEQSVPWTIISLEIERNAPTIQELGLRKIPVIHFFVREEDSEEVSHYIMPRNQDAFLMKAPKRFKSMRQTVWWLPANYGDTRLSSVRGIASYLYPHCDLSNRYLGRIFDQAFMRNSVVLRPRTMMDLSRLKVVRFGPFTILPPDLNMDGTLLAGGDFSSSLAIRETSFAILKNNTGIYKPYTESVFMRQGMKTARQVIEEVSRESRMERAKVTFDYMQLEILYREMFRRLMNNKSLDGADWPGSKDAVDFFERCRARGVPDDYLGDPNIWIVRVAKAIGLGSYGVKYDISQQVIGMSPYMPVKGARAAIRDRLAVLVGWENVDRYFPAEGLEDVPSNDDSIASLENTALLTGHGMVKVGAEQDHVSHLRTHGEPILQLMQVLQGIQEGKVDLLSVDWEKSSVMLVGLIQHLSEHRAFIEKDPLMKSFVQQVDQLLGIAKQVAEFSVQILPKVLEAKQARKEEGKEPPIVIQPSPEVERLRMEREKQASINRMRLEKTRVQNLIRTNWARAQIELSKEQYKAKLRSMVDKLRGDLTLKIVANSGVPKEEAERTAQELIPDISPEVDRAMDSIVNSLKWEVPEAVSEREPVQSAITDQEIPLSETPVNEMTEEEQNELLERTD